MEVLQLIQLNTNLALPSITRQDYRGYNGKDQCGIRCDYFEESSRLRASRYLEYQVETGLGENVGGKPVLRNSWG